MTEGNKKPGLCLKVRPGECVFIGDEIIITLTDCHRDYARLHIHAPKSIEIDRECVRKAKELSRKEASL